MARVCSCPRDAAIPTIPNQSCKFSVGQVQKAALQRLRANDGSSNSFPMTSTGAVNLLASWTTLIAADDDTKIQVTPLISNPTFTAGEAQIVGEGGNETPDGAGVIVSTGVSTLTGEFHNIEQAIIKALKDYSCELNDDLGIYLFLPGNRLLAQVIENEVYPIPIRNFWVGNFVPGGYAAIDMNMFSLRFWPDWSDDLQVVALDFNPILDLRNA